MTVVKKVVAAVKKAVTKKVAVVKTEEVTVGCSNCDNSGLFCRECSPVFTDTFQ